ASIQLADNAWHSPDGLRRCKELLESLWPQACEPDLRRFEWHYLNRLCHPDRLVIRGHTSAVRGLTRSRDGARLAGLDEGGNGPGGVGGRGREVLSWQAHGGRVTAIALSPDGSTLATAGQESRGLASGRFVVKLWDAHTGRLVTTLRPDACFRISTLH